MFLNRNRVLRFTILGLTATLCGVLGIHTGVSSEPQPASNPTVQKGASLYTQNCAICHGKTGKGDGLAGKSLKPSPRDFSKGVFKYSKNDAELLKFIKRGKGPMPAWEKTLNDEQIQAIIAYIHTLKAPQESK